MFVFLCRLMFKNKPSWLVWLAYNDRFSSRNRTEYSRRGASTRANYSLKFYFLFLLFVFYTVGSINAGIFSSFSLQCTLTLNFPNAYKLCRRIYTRGPTKKSTVKRSFIFTILRYYDIKHSVFFHFSNIY